MSPDNHDALNTTIRFRSGNMPDDMQLSALRAMLDDPHPAVRQVALDHIESLPEHQQEPALWQALRDGDPAVRLRAASILARSAKLPSRPRDGIPTPNAAPEDPDLEKHTTQLQRMPRFPTNTISVNSTSTKPPQQPAPAVEELVSSPSQMSFSRSSSRYGAPPSTTRATDTTASRLDAMPHQLVLERPGPSFRTFIGAGFKIGLALTLVVVVGFDLIFTITNWVLVLIGISGLDEIATVVEGLITAAGGLAGAVLGGLVWISTWPFRKSDI